MQSGRGGTILPLKVAKNGPSTNPIFQDCGRMRNEGARMTDLCQTAETERLSHPETKAFAVYTGTQPHRWYVKPALVYRGQPLCLR